MEILSERSFPTSTDIFVDQVFVKTSESVFEETDPVSADWTNVPGYFVRDGVFLVDEPLGNWLECHAVILVFFSYLLRQ